MIDQRKIKFIQRLTEEWIKYGRVVLAADFDDTLKPWEKDGKTLVEQAECDYALDKLREAREIGAYIVINTACNPDRFEEIRSYCDDKGVVIDSINTNPIDLPYGQHGKVYANWYLDDRADFYGALEILDLAMHGVRGYWATKNLDDVA